MNNALLIEKLVELNPVIATNWANFIAERSAQGQPEHPLDGLFFADFSKSLTKIEDIKDLFSILENVLTEGDRETKIVATIYLLDKIISVEKLKETATGLAGKYTLRQIQKLKKHKIDGTLISDD